MRCKNILLILAVILELAAVVCVVISMMDRITVAFQTLCRVVEEKKSLLCKKAGSPCWEDEFEDWEV